MTQSKESDELKELLKACTEAHDLVLKIAYLKGNVLKIAHRKTLLTLDASNILGRAIRQVKCEIKAAEKKE